jgi:hypothetical protein
MMGFVQQYSPNATKMVEVFCKTGPGQKTPAGGAKKPGTR